MYSSKIDCLSNCTINSQHSCTWLSVGWTCDCVLPYNWESGCKTVIYSDYYQLSHIYYVIGPITLIPGALLFLLEILLTLKHKQPLLNVTFITKCISLIFATLRLFNYAIVARTLTTGTYDMEAPDNIFTFSGTMVGVAMYFMCTIMWLDFVLCLSNSAPIESSSKYKVIRSVYVICTAILVLGGAVTGLIGVLVLQIFNIIHLIWVGGPLCINIIFCYYNIALLRKELRLIEPKLKKKMIKKNTILAWMSFFFFIGFLECTIYYIFIVGLKQSSSYMPIQYGTRAMETILFYLFFVFYQQYVMKLFHQKPKPSKRDTTGTASNFDK